MRILFTGASSFTGFWFVRMLRDAGHEVHAIFTHDDDAAYGADVRGERVRLLDGRCERVFGCRFGDDAFFKLIAARGPWSVLCHHAADVRDYKSTEFDVARAVSMNTHQLAHVFDTLREHDCRRIVVTGSVFEGGEGAGSEGLPDFSPYGLSKRLTAEVFRYYCRVHGFRLGKFVIPNPFGPYEEPRFTAYLLRTWMSGDVAEVRTPRYVRDNIHVQWLAEEYVRAVESASVQPGYTHFGPSCYVSTQGEFAQRVVRAVQPRLGLPCELRLADQEHFAEPRVRINTDPIDPASYSVDEAAAWGALADYYQSRANALLS